MRETEFINQNKDKWQEFEKTLKDEKKDPEKLSRLFIETTDDLSHSRTYYPNRSVRVYLNGISQSIFEKIYKTRRDKRNTFSRFWKEILPDAMWHARKALLLSFILFIGAFILGFFSGQNHPEYAEIMLGDYYINLTEGFIEAGDPMAIYKQTPPLEMFLMIAQNNIRVCFTDFLTGIIAGVGTIFSLLFEGTRIGAFFQFFYGRGLLDEALLTVMLHGTLELSMIVLSGCAGLTLASGLLFPGNYSRLQSLVLSARRAIIIMIGVTVFLLLAAFIEGFVTRMTEAPDIIKGLIILFSFSLVAGYFVIYPHRRNKKGLISHEMEDDLQPSRESHIEKNEVKSSGQIFTEMFALFRASIKGHFRFAIIASAILSIFVLYITDFNLESFIIDASPDELFFPLNIIWIWDDLNNYFAFNSYLLLYPAYVLTFAVLLSFSAWYFTCYDKKIPFVKFIAPRWPSFLLITSLMLGPLFLEHVYAFGLLIVIWPLALFMISVITHENCTFAVAFSRTLKLLQKRWAFAMGILIISMAVPWIAMFAQSSYLWAYIFFFLEMNLRAEWTITTQLPFFIYTLIGYLIMLVMLPLIYYAFQLFYFSCVEIAEATSLRQRIQKIDFKTKAYGLEKES